MKWASAAFRCPCRASEEATASSTSMPSFPASARRKSRTAPTASPVSSSRRSVTTSAPALMNGLRGIPCSVSNCTNELNGFPDGSRPTRLHSSSPPSASASASVNSFDTLCTENGVSQSPAPYTSPSTVAIAIPNAVGSTAASAGM